jgi:hypothetical protein
MCSQRAVLASLRTGKSSVGACRRKQKVLGHVLAPIRRQYISGDAAPALGTANIFALVRRAVSRQHDLTKDSQIPSPVASAPCRGLLKGF